MNKSPPSGRVAQTSGFGLVPPSGWVTVVLSCGWSSTCLYKCHNTRMPTASKNNPHAFQTDPRPRAPNQTPAGFGTQTQPAEGPKALHHQDPPKAGINIRVFFACEVQQRCLSWNPRLQLEQSWDTLGPEKTNRHATICVRPSRNSAVNDSQSHSHEITRHHMTSPEKQRQGAVFGRVTSQVVNTCRPGLAAKQAAQWQVCREESRN